MVVKEVDRTRPSPSPSREVTVQPLDTDYLVVGGGAMGLAFTDEILTHNPTARIIIVDKRAKPGGHWNDAYPFVSLHQPAAYYGVNSMKLGSGGAALASGFEVLSYFERVLRKMLDTGRVQYFPMCVYDGDKRFRSIIATGQNYEVTVRKKTVDATYMNVEVPATTPPKYEVASEVAIIPLNELPRVRQPKAGYVIIGAGKTGIDAVLFLLGQGVHPDDITWIMPNDSWLMERTLIQPGRIMDWLADQLDIFARSNTLEEVFLTLEADKIFFRLDEKIWPTKFRCATVNREELTLLRGIENIVRMGRIVRIEPAEIVLESGSLPTAPDTLHVDCTADPLAKRDIRPVFDGANITLQSVSMCQQVFSAALIGYVEGQYEGDQKKNGLCQVVPHPEVNRDYVTDMAITAANSILWQREFFRWLRKSRLSQFHHESLFTLITRGLKVKRVEAKAFEKMRLIFEQEFPGKKFPVDSSAPE